LSEVLGIKTTTGEALGIAKQTAVRDALGITKKTGRGTGD